jgi:hypothetical protein
MNATEADQSTLHDETEYEEWLNENYEEIDICGYKYDAGCVLSQIDPTAFREEYNDWLDNFDPLYECSECGERFNNEDSANECCVEEEVEEKEDLDLLGLNKLN